MSCLGAFVMRLIPPALVPVLVWLFVTAVCHHLIDKFVYLPWLELHLSPDRLVSLSGKLWPILLLISSHLVNMLSTNLVLSVFSSESVCHLLPLFLLERRTSYAITPCHVEPTNLSARLLRSSWYPWVTWNTHLTVWLLRPHWNPPAYWKAT